MLIIVGVQNCCKDIWQVASSSQPWYTAWWKWSHITQLSPWTSWYY